MGKWDCQAEYINRRRNLRRKEEREKERKTSGVTQLDRHRVRVNLIFTEIKKRKKPRGIR